MMVYEKYTLPPILMYDVLKTYTDAFGTST